MVYKKIIFKFNLDIKKIKKFHEDEKINSINYFGLLN